VTDNTTPHFPPQWQPLVDRAASALRELAVNEEAKARFLEDPQLRPYMERVSQRYVAGSTVSDVIVRAAMINQNGHRASAEYMGESVRDEAFANEETSVFLHWCRPSASSAWIVRSRSTCPTSARWSTQNWVTRTRAASHGLPAKSGRK